MKEKTCKLIIASYRIDLYLPDCRLAIEIYENDHNDNNIDYEIKRQKAIGLKLGYKFIRIDPEKEDFGIHKAINEILKHINHSSKKTLIDKISKRLLRSEFKPAIRAPLSNVPLIGDILF